MSIHIFKVKTDKDGDEREMRVDRPKGIHDLGTWQDRIEAANDEELEAKINDLAFGNWVIKWQDAFRRKRSVDPATWKYGAPVARGFQQPEAKADMFDEDQQEYLRSIGVKVA